MPYHTSYLTEYVHFAVPNGKGGGIDILIGPGSGSVPFGQRESAETCE
jgi:hypothetical protein